MGKDLVPESHLSLPLIVPLQLHHVSVDIHKTIETQIVWIMENLLGVGNFPLFSIWIMFLHDVEEFRNCFELFFADLHGCPSRF